MFDLQILREEPLIKFNRQLPVFNWPYPFHRQADILKNRYVPYTHSPQTAVRRRAVYIHIPFCETICSFCPFSREKHKSDSDIEDYVHALIAELDMKQHFLGRRTVDTIFVGGGTPSLLSPRQIGSLGKAIARNLDLSSLNEFTFEVEVKSVSRAKLEALRDIGVNRVSFGAQTFSEHYRALFSLDATHQQISSAAELLTNMFSYTNVDLLYGMAGQDLDQVQTDVAAAVNLQTTTIDVYPINTFSVSRSMHMKMARAGLELLPEATRVQFRIHIEQLFRQLGYAPISGYGFAAADKAKKNKKDPVQHSPKFLYHDLVYGYQDDEIIGYGSAALSHMPGFNLHNFGNRKEYVAEVLINKALPHLAFGPLYAPERGIVSFPFRGSLEKARITWSEIPDETAVALQDALDAELIADQDDAYVLTEAGWLFYVNLMYYLMPTTGKKWITDKMAQQGRNGKRCGDTDLTEFSRSRF
ncbi:MAG TPA: radical SAM protein [Terriglobales bacterium]|nr:radical SAM protein [Terriglobales bacterium]